MPIIEVVKISRGDEFWSAASSIDLRGADHSLEFFQTARREPGLEKSRPGLFATTCALFGSK
ncbi:MAG: hypothetical protein CBC13_10965 [Planctomycetia bacterium TMED53]|nr:MAG: hypothetical protein CBC13_10965 [Planctomycetia bacterium TMED53]